MVERQAHIEHQARILLSGLDKNFTDGHDDAASRERVISRLIERFITQEANMTDRNLSPNANVRHLHGREGIKNKAGLEALINFVQTKFEGTDADKPDNYINFTKLSEVRKQVGELLHRYQDYSAMWQCAADKMLEYTNELWEYNKIEHKHFVLAPTPPANANSKLPQQIEHVMNTDWWNKFEEYLKKVVESDADTDAEEDAEEMISLGYFDWYE